MQPASASDNLERIGYCGGIMTEPQILGYRAIATPNDRKFMDSMRKRLKYQVCYALLDALEEGKPYTVTAEYEEEELENDDLRLSYSVTLEAQDDRPGH